MTQRNLRARDVDRDAAIDVVEAAWADGQLTREEYDRRVDRLLQATTLGDLEGEILDLQPEGVNWKPRTADFSVTPANSALISADEHKRLNRPVAIALTLTIIVIAGLATLSAFDGETPTPAAKPVDAVTSSLLTSAGFISARDALDDYAGSDAVYSARLTPQRFDVIRPTSGAGTDAIRTSYDGTQWSPERPAESDEERLSLGLVNADAVSTILTDAREQAGADVEVALVFEIAHQDGQRICITASTSGHSKWVGRYDCRGQEVTR